MAPILLWRYILRSMVGPFLFGTAIIIFIFLSQYMINYLPKLAGKGLGLEVIGEFMVLNMSWIIVLAVPIGVLFASVMSFGALSATHEVTVMKASGMGLIRMMVPVALVGAVLWGATFWYTDNVLPDTNLRLSSMMQNIQRLKPTFVIEAGQFTTQIDGFTILARRMDSAGVMQGITIYDRTKPDRLTIVSANVGRLSFSPSYTRLIVDLTQGEVHQSRISDRKPYRVVEFDTHRIVMRADRFFYEEPDVSGSSRGDREMRISDMQQIVDRSDSIITAAQAAFRNLLQHHVHTVLHAPSAVAGRGNVGQVDEPYNRALGFVTTERTALETELYREDAEQRMSSRYEVEIHKKYAIPFACLLFVFVGAPLGILTKGGNFGIGAAISLACYIGYWVTLIGGEELADRGMLAPEIAMWTGNALFLLIGVATTVRVNNR